MMAGGVLLALKSLGKPRKGTRVPELQQAHRASGGPAVESLTIRRDQTLTYNSLFSALSFG